MLTIALTNDGTEKEAPELIGHYVYEVAVNGEVIAQGKLRNFNRMTGWKGLIHYLGTDVFANPEEVGGEGKSITWEKA
jgi:hypothetical protein